MEIYKTLEENETYKNILENVSDEEKKVIKDMVKEFTYKMESGILGKLKQLEKREDKDKIIEEIKKNING